MSTTIEETLRALSRELAEAGIPEAQNDARYLLSFALDIERDRLTLVAKDAITPGALGRLDQAIADRLQRKPVSHIIGWREFWGRRFKVTPGVLDPRPETETLIAAALNVSFTNVLDLGTGSGCILLTLLAEKTGATGLGLDVSQEALEVAVENRSSLGLDRAALFKRSDWFAEASGRFDLIVANPPYIPLQDMAALSPEVLRWEPMSALTPGLSGLESYAEIAASVAEFLLPQGRVMCEVGPDQADDVAALFVQAGLTHIAHHKDMDGRERVVEMQLLA